MNESMGRLKRRQAAHWSRGGRYSAVGLLALWLASCGPTAAVSMSVKRTPQTPPDASVTIDEEFVGLLSYVAARGVRLPAGEHHITVERDGYFPWDRIVVSDRKPIRLEVDLIPLPD
jgi:hypothetical protein